MTRSRGRLAQSARLLLFALPVLLAIAAPAGALTFRIDASADPLVPGELVTATLRLLGVGDGDHAIGAFDIRLDWDAAVFAIESVAILPALGGPDDALDTSTVGDGHLRLSSISLLPAGALAELQDDDIGVASIALRALAPGSTALGPSLLVLGDAQGAPLEVDEISSPTLKVVPEPASLALLAVGLLCAGLCARRPRG